MRPNLSGATSSRTHQLSRSLGPRRTLPPQTKSTATLSLSGTTTTLSSYHAHHRSVRLGPHARPISRHHGHRLHGTTNSGRGVAISGVEAMIGPTISTVPVRVMFEKTQGVDSFMVGIQSQYAAMMEPRARRASDYQTRIR